MKKMICLLLALLLLCGCSKNKEDIQAPVNFYYPNADVSYNTADAVLSAEIREGAAYTDDLIALLNLYLSGPLSDNFTSHFPPGSSVVNAFLEETTLVIELNPEFTKLHGMDLTVASACLAKTAIDITGCNQVKLYVQDTKLDGNAHITLGASDLLLIDAINESAV